MLYMLLASKQTNRQTDLKGQHSLKLFLFICGGPRHLSSFKQCSGDLIFLWKQLVCSVMEKKQILMCLYYYLIIYLKYLKSWVELHQNHTVPIKSMLNATQRFLNIKPHSLYSSFTNNHKHQLQLYNKNFRLNFNQVCIYVLLMVTVHCSYISRCWSNGSIELSVH